MLCTRSTSGDVWLISCENIRLPRQQAAGRGITENREEVNYFHFLEKSLVRVCSVGSAYMGQVNSERSEGWRNRMGSVGGGCGWVVMERVRGEEQW